MSTRQRILTAEEKKIDIRDNLTKMLLYSLSLATALGLNEAMITVFDSFKISQTRVLAKILYVFFMAAITIGVAYFLRANVHV